MVRGDTDLISGYYPGSIAGIQNAFNDQYPFMLFPIDGSSAFLGFTRSFNLSDQRYESPFGTITPKAFNMTAFGFNSTKAIMSVWGISCQISRQEGTMDLARTADGQWRTTTSSMAFEKAKTIHQPLRMQQLQMNLNYQAPDVTIAGLGSALARSADPCADSLTSTSASAAVDDPVCTTDANSSTVDFATLARNFLYASAETERLAYEVASSNGTRAQPGSVYTVPNTRETLRYRITYVPVILFVGVGCVFLAALIALGLRLIVDCLAGLGGGEREAYDGVKAGDSNGALLAWAQAYRVRYEKRARGEKVGLVRVQ